MNKSVKVMCFSILVNLTLSIIKIIVGFFGNSGALIADGIHSLSDFGTDFFAIAGTFFSNKPADENHPYGHGNIEYLTSIGISIGIIIVGISIIYEAITRNIIIPSLLVIFVSLFTIIAKYLLASFILRKGKEYNNHILIASAKESNMDVISSVVVLVSSVLIQFSKQIPILKYSDKVCMFVIGIFIIIVGINILKENISLILGKQVDNEELKQNIENILLKHEKVHGVMRFILIKFGPHYKFSCTLKMEENLSLKEAHKITEELENEIKEYNKDINYINIHMEPKEDNIQ